MIFHPDGVKPPLVRMLLEDGEIPEPEVSWCWNKMRFEVSYDGGHSWYDRDAAVRAQRRVDRYITLISLYAFLRDLFRPFRRDLDSAATEPTDSRAEDEPRRAAAAAARGAQTAEEADLAKVWGFSERASREVIARFAKDEAPMLRVVSRSGHAPGEPSRPSYAALIPLCRELGIPESLARTFWSTSHGFVSTSAKVGKSARATLNKEGTTKHAAFRIATIMLLVYRHPHLVVKYAPVAGQPPPRVHSWARSVMRLNA